MASVMFSIRTKITLLTVCAIIAAMAAATFLSVTAIKRMGDSSSRQILWLLCETGEKNLDSYFRSVEQSVEMVSSFVESDLENLGPDQLDSHIDRVNDIFHRMANKTSGILTYYYRIDPEISEEQKGFWFVNYQEDGFQEHEVTDIARYDTGDTSSLVWFTVPKATGKSVWLPPYITVNLDARVISYNVPVYQSGRFLGVVGIEIDYATVADQVKNIRLYENGYAFIVDENGNMIYHPYMEAAQNQLSAPDSLLGDSSYLKYSWNGVDKQAVWRPLHNGMRLYVSVPISEINGDWQQLIYWLFSVSVLLLTAFVILTMGLTGYLTRPLLQLTKAARQAGEGNYDFDFSLDYRGNDEVGVLTSAFRQLADNLKAHISDLNSLAYADALTSVHNKGAYDIHLRKLEARLHTGGKVEFAAGVFDCDNLKRINDQYGHEKGDIYLKTASALICQVFQHSPVFRTGGDEFTVFLENDDYRDREELQRFFARSSAEICASTDVPWEQVRVSLGLAVYDPQTDQSAGDVVRRADKLMYENKHERKRAGQVLQSANQVKTSA